MRLVDSDSQKRTGQSENSRERVVLPDGGEQTDPFAPIRKHEDTIEEIAAGNGPDAHVARVLLALKRGEEPNPDDLNRLFNGPTETPRERT